MKKKYVWILFLLITMITVAGCGSEKLSTESGVNSMPESLNSANSAAADSSYLSRNSSTASITGSSVVSGISSAATDDEIISHLYGSWKVEKYLANVPISDTSKDERTQIIGLIITFSKKSIVNKGVTYDNPMYNIDTKNNRTDFFAQFKVTADKLELTGDKIYTIGLYKDSKMIDNFDFTYCVLLDSDNNLVLNTDSRQFFKLKKQ